MAIQISIIKDSAAECSVKNHGITDEPILEQVLNLHTALGNDLNTEVDQSLLDVCSKLSNSFSFMDRPDWAISAFVSMAKGHAELGSDKLSSTIIDRLVDLAIQTKDYSIFYCLKDFEIGRVSNGGAILTSSDIDTFEKYDSKVIRAVSHIQRMTAYRPEQSRETQNLPWVDIYNFRYADFRKTFNGQELEAICTFFDDKKDYLTEDIFKYPADTAELLYFLFETGNTSINLDLVTQTLNRSSRNVATTISLLSILAQALQAKGASLTDSYLIALSDVAGVDCLPLLGEIIYHRAINKKPAIEIKEFRDLCGQITQLKSLGSLFVTKIIEFARKRSEISNASEIFCSDDLSWLIKLNSRRDANFNFDATKSVLEDLSKVQEAMTQENLGTLTAKRISSLVGIALAGCSRIKNSSGNSVGMLLAHFPEYLKGRNEFPSDKELAALEQASIEPYELKKFFSCINNLFNRGILKPNSENYDLILSIANLCKIDNVNLELLLTSGNNETLSVEDIDKAFTDLFEVCSSLDSQQNNSLMTKINEVSTLLKTQGETDNVINICKTLVLMVDFAKEKKVSISDLVLSLERSD